MTTSLCTLLFVAVHLLNASSSRVRLAVKIRDEYRDYKELPPSLLSQQGPVGPSRPAPTRKMITAGGGSQSYHVLVPSMTDNTD